MIPSNSDFYQFEPTLRKTRLDNNNDNHMQKIDGSCNQFYFIFGVLNYEKLDNAA